MAESEVVEQRDLNVLRQLWEKAVLKVLVKKKKKIYKTAKRDIRDIFKDYFRL